MKKIALSAAAVTILLLPLLFLISKGLPDKPGKEIPYPFDARETMTWIAGAIERTYGPKTNVDFKNPRLPIPRVFELSNEKMKMLWDKYGIKLEHYPEFKKCGSQIIRAGLYVSGTIYLNALMKTEAYGGDARIPNIIIHELTHHIQMSYLGMRPPDPLVESMAREMAKSYDKEVRKRIFVSRCS